MFDYLIDKIRSAEFRDVPFSHVHISNFLSSEHFREVVSSDEIRIPPQADDGALIGALKSKGYRVIRFPGCITNEKAYIAWHRRKSFHRGWNNSSCEGFGMALRLAEARTPIVAHLQAFLASEAFNKVLAEKFRIPFEEVSADNGIQKYLDGYEISPHPDLRRKALTFMVNINPHADSEQMQHHTHYLRFSDRYKFIQEFWAGNPRFDTCWVPWSWCETLFEQRENNSMVIFSPATDTLHAVKASYDHLRGQRTQLYGNLWYEDRYRNLIQPSWESLDLPEDAPPAEPRTRVATAKDFVRALFS